jgi:hypothetical protein
MRTKEIQVGDRYTCQFRGRERVVIVEAIDTARNPGHRVKIQVREEGTGNALTLRSPGQLRGHLPPS